MIHRTHVSAAVSAVCSLEVGSSLGTYAKSSTPPKIDSNVLAIKRGHRVERYALLSAARHICLDAGTAKGLLYKHDFHRVAKCCYVPHGQGVAVHHAVEYGAAFYSGLIACGSVWACPVCSAKIQERRRDEIAQAIDWAYAQHLQPIMVTLTFPHYAFHKLGDLLEKQKLAFQYLRSGARFSRFKESFDYQGLIRSLELMHGVNGWHPHTHELWFCKTDAFGAAAGSVAAAMQIEILRMWEASCIKAELLDPNDKKQMAAFQLHAVDVKGNCSKSDYLAKMDDAKYWGADREMAKGTKKDSTHGVHPFGLLKQASEGSLRAKRLYLAYIIAMKGKRQIFWSHGLKKRVGVDDKSDEALAEETREDADLLGQIEYKDWQNVRQAEQRAQLLTAAEKGGWPAVVALVQSLRPVLKLVQLAEVRSGAYYRPARAAMVDADGVIHD